jgi:hypothetical protein
VTRAPSFDDRRVHSAVEAIRALRTAGVEDPFAELRADLHKRLAADQADERETHELLLRAEALTTLGAEADAMALLPH